jgi:hypothetical protein
MSKDEANTMSDSAHSLGCAKPHGSAAQHHHKLNQQ